MLRIHCSTKVSNLYVLRCIGAVIVVDNIGRTCMDESNSQWLTIEMRLCREVFGLTQAKMAKVAGVGLQTIKNMEKSGLKSGENTLVNPRVSTLVNLRETFRMLGVKFHVDEDERACFTFKPAVVAAIETGELSVYVEKQIKLIMTMRSESTRSARTFVSFDW